MFKYNIAVGINHHTFTEVVARDDADAFMKARKQMDGLYAEMDREAPVAWDLAIVTRTALSDQDKVELVEDALRTERDRLRSIGNPTAANAINTYLQHANGDSKVRFYGVFAP